MDMQPDWVQLADAKFWGLMVAILAAAAMGYVFLVYIFKQWINASSEDTKFKTEQVTRVASETSRHTAEVAKATSERFESLVKDANFYREIMTKAIQDNTHALTGIDKTVENVARMVEQCPKRGD